MLLTVVSVSVQWNSNTRCDDGTNIAHLYTTNRCQWNALFLHIL